MTLRQGLDPEARQRAAQALAAYAEGTAGEAPFHGLKRVLSEVGLDIEVEDTQADYTATIEMTLRIPVEVRADSLQAASRLVETLADQPTSALLRAAQTVRGTHRRDTHVLDLERKA